MPSRLLPTVPLARYIFDRKHHDVGRRVLKPRAFYPWPEAEPQFSTFRSDLISDDECWNRGVVIGNSREPTRALKARGDLPVGVYRDHGLDDDYDDDPEDHVNIVGWPLAKEDQIEKAQQLARAFETQGAYFSVPT